MIKILFEDNHLLVIEKPAGIPTQKSKDCEESLEEQAKAFLKKRDRKPGQVFLHPIHRLDKAVSGIVVFAKTSKSLSRLNAFIREKKAKKTYHALVESTDLESGVLEHYLRHDAFQAYVSLEKIDSETRWARLTYKVIEKRESCSLVEIELDTGRYHQIRAQFGFINAPILGDYKYGSKTRLKAASIALHHSHFEILHPITKRSLLFSSLYNFS